MNSIKLKKYKLRKKSNLAKVLNSDSAFAPFNKLVFKLHRQGIWQKMTLKMKKEFSKRKNWKLTTKTFQIGKRKGKSIKYFEFTKLKQYLGSIKGMETLKSLRTMEGLNKLSQEYHKKYMQYLGTKNNERQGFTFKQEQELRKMKNTLLWSQLQNAKTQQRKETIKQQIKYFKQDIGAVPTLTGASERIDFTTFIMTYKYDIFEKYAEIFKDYTGKEGTYSEVITVFKDEMLTELGLEPARKGGKLKDEYQEGVYWDDTHNMIIYIDI